MALADIVRLTISRSAPGLQAAGFGTGLIATPYPTWVERTREYESTTEVLVDFPSTTIEYAAAVAYFGQNPSPEKLLFGRMANKPTKKQVLSLVAVVDSTAYSVRAWCAGKLQTATFTSGVSTTGDLIVAGLVTALNALAVPDIGATSVASGSGASAIVTTTADAAGNYFDLEVLDLNLLSLQETETDPGIVADLTAMAAESSGWYGLGMIYKSDAIVLAAAGWVEANTKLFPVASSASECATHVVSGATDILATLKNAARARSAGAYHPRNYECFDVAEMGRWFPIKPGSDNWRMKTLSGVTPGVGVALKALSSTQVTNILNKYGNYYAVLGTADNGVNVVLGVGLVADHEYIDVVRGIDWWSANLTTKLINLEYAVEKIPFTDDGVNLIKNQVKAQNTEGVAANLINPTPVPTVTAPKVADVSSANKAARNLPDVNTAWKLAGAINTMDVNAAITS